MPLMLQNTLPKIIVTDRLPDRKTKKRPPLLSIQRDISCQ